MVRFTEHTEAGAVIFAHETKAHRTPLPKPAADTFCRKLPPPRIPTMPPASENSAPGANGYWRAVIRFTLLLLAIWTLVSIVAAILFVEPLNAFHVGRLPAGFWMAQQGSILVFVALIFIYARRMDKLDHEFRKDADDAGTTESQP